MRFLPVNIVGVTIWKKFYRFPHLLFQIAVELPALPVVEETSAAIHLHAQQGEFAGEINKGGRLINVRRF